ncbi:MAG: Asp-tRNA(Asn)/Glu-tRNA(Gln) amidotransferase subunit GatC [Cyclobacteriaceae bacterium]|nr:Asp-tRNA(Asn)/Glu-tRNA(Gln) amidotransferase subunit GatC [Cyclobacteriaceae bacterium]
MKITDELLDRIAHLARLEIKEEEREALKKDMDAILEWVDKLKEVDTEGVEPLVYMSHEVDSVREDIVENQLSQKEALDNAPDTDSTFFRVPKVINKSNE